MEPLNAFLLFVLFIIAIVLLVTVLKTLFTVRTATAGIVERFGKFNRIVRPGLHLLIPYAERVFFVDLQVKQAQFSVETKTRDNVLVQIPVSIQYQVLDDKIYDSFYKLSAPQKQIESFVFNSILGHVPKLTLDETFEQQSGISVAVKVELDTIMSGFGFNILTALVTDIIPDVKVKAAMNDINAAQRAQVAAQARGEADKILKVKQAEAEAESKALQGKGSRPSAKPSSTASVPPLSTSASPSPAPQPTMSWRWSCSPSTSTHCATSAPEAGPTPSSCPTARARPTTS
jgi:regulator of protease activity HflC (stomatin/prohibitin superfamily)